MKVNTKKQYLLLTIGTLLAIGLSACAPYKVSIKDVNPEGFIKPVAKTGKVHLYPCVADPPLVDLGEGKINLDPNYPANRSGVYTTDDILTTLTNRSIDTLKASGHQVTVGEIASSDSDIQIYCTLKVFSSWTKFNSAIPGLIATSLANTAIFTGGTSPKTAIQVLYAFSFGQSPQKYTVPIAGKAGSWTHLTARGGHDNATEKALRETQSSLSQLAYFSLSDPDEFKKKVVEINPDYQK